MGKEREKAIKKSASQNRRRRKKSKIRLLLVLLVLVVLTVGVLGYTVLFPIGVIDVKGTTIYSKEQIIDASKLEQGDKMFAVSAKNTKNNIITKLPYIKDVSLTRSLPGTMILNVTADKAAYSFEQDGAYIYTNSEYKSLEKAPEPNSEAVTVKGVRLKTYETGKTAVFENEDKLKLAENLLTLLKQQEIKVLQIDVTEEFSQKAVIGEGITVDFGGTADLNYKISHLKGMLNELNDKKTGYINLKSWSKSNPKAYFTNSEG